MRSLAIAVADLRQRLGGTTIWVLLGIGLYLGTMMLPDAHAGYFVLSLNDRRGIYTSDWVAAATSLMLVTLLAFFGIFAARGGVERDLELRTADYVTASPCPSTIFIGGKWLSSVFVLSLVCVTVFCGAVIEQLLRGDRSHMTLVPYMMDFTCVVLPVCALVAAISALFSCTRLLRGTFGLVIYVAFVGVIGLALTQTPWSLDPWGYHSILDAMGQQLLAQTSSDEIHQTLIGIPPASGATPTFRFVGISWTMASIMVRAAWIGAACVLACGAGLTFDRYRGRNTAGRSANRITDVLFFRSGLINAQPLSELPILLGHFSITWWLCASVAVLAALLAPEGIVDRFVVPFLLLLPVNALAEIGSRDRDSGSRAIAVLAAGNTAILFFRRMAACCVIQAILWLPLATRSVDQPSRAFLFLLVPIAASILALTLGLLTRGPRIFEGVFLVWWFLGPLNHVAPFDPYVTQNAANTTAWLCVIAIAAAAVASAVERRRASIPA
jgi:hypothetical protein